MESLADQLFSDSPLPAHEWSLLHQPAIEGNVENLKALLDAGAGVDTPDGNGCTALLLAAENACSDCVEMLLG